MRFMKIYVGTSGWFYRSWNPKLSLEWYLQNSGLNSLELNSSFYRFPLSNYVKSWIDKTKKFNPKLRWVIKVNRLITHVFKFNERAFGSWKRFEDSFKPLDKNIDFYLFQLPPSSTPNSFKKIEAFVKKTKLKKRFALEIRNNKWFDDKWLKWAKKLKVTWVSVDSPDLPLDVYNVNGIVYERMHGRTSWYSHYYTDKELKEVAEKILRTKPKKVYVMFNNNHSMLENSKRMLDILSHDS